MNNKKISLALALGLIFMPMSAKAAQSENFKRLSGNNRYATAKAISNYGWTSSNYVIIAQGENFPDALCSVPLAKKYDAPILLTSKDTLSKEAEEELIRLNPESIIIVGGEGSISTKIEQYIKGKFESVAIERIGGKDRFETSTKIAEKLGFNGEAAFTSSVSFADALSMAPIAAVKEMPILLTPKDKLSDYTANYLKGKTLNNAYIIGGTGVVSDSLKSKISNSKRIYGENRFATNVAILKEFKDQLAQGNVFTALGNGPKGNEFADALSGAALAAKMQAPMMLTDKTLPKEIKNYVLADVTKEAKLFALGGEAVVTNDIVNYIKTNKGQGTEVQNPEVPVVPPVNPEVPVVPPVTPPVTPPIVPGPVNPSTFSVKSVNFHLSNGQVAQAELKSGKIIVSIPSSVTVTKILVSTSDEILSADCIAGEISNSTIKSLYGENATEIDLVEYVRYKGFDKENDGLSVSNLQMLNGTYVTVTGKSGSLSYMLQIN